MTEGSVYEAADEYGRAGKIAYSHFRNVFGKVPYYCEAFIYEGEIDMLRILANLKRTSLKES